MKKTLIAVDVSGSMGGPVADGPGGLTERITNLLRALHKSATCVLFDQAIVTVLKPKDSFKFPEARGGTDIQCVVDYVKKSKGKFDRVFIITDGMFLTEDLPNKKKYHIILTSKDCAHLCDYPNVTVF